MHATRAHCHTHRRNAALGLRASRLPPDLVSIIAVMVAESVRRAIESHNRAWERVMRELVESVGVLHRCECCDEFVDEEDVCYGDVCKFFDDDHCMDCCQCRLDDFASSAHSFFASQSL